MKSVVKSTTRRAGRSLKVATAAEEWQRAQAWATWEKIKAGDVRETSLEELRAMISNARRAADRRRSRSA